MSGQGDDKTRRGEFSLIGDLFAPLSRGAPEALGLMDDAALLDFNNNEQVVISADALVAGVHFFPDDAPEDVAAKALRVNLSDLAAMGATPRGLFLTLMIPNTLDDAWLQTFTDGLCRDLNAYDVVVYGGDTVSTPGPLALSITILGVVPHNAALRRSGAEIGEDVWVSGTLGDSALGLSLIRREISVAVAPEERAFLIHRYRYPQPRVTLGIALRGIASSCMDISDGLIADAGHIAKASGVEIDLAIERLPLSPATARVVSENAAMIEKVVGGGDDYELLFTAPKSQEQAVREAASHAGVTVTRIGRVKGTMQEPVSSGNRVRLVDAAGRERPVVQSGWSHRAS